MSAKSEDIPELPLQTSIQAVLSKKGLPTSTRESLCKAWDWTQTKEEVSLTIELDQDEFKRLKDGGVPVKHMFDMTIGQSLIDFRVACDGGHRDTYTGKMSGPGNTSVIWGSLFGRVDPDQCFWELEEDAKGDAIVLITLPKLDYKRHWQHAVTGQFAEETARDS